MGESDRATIAIPILVGLTFAALLWLISYHHGALASLGGQIYYFQGAAQFLNGNGLTDCDGKSISFIPPGYTFLLIALKSLGLSLIDSGRLIGILSAGVFAGASAFILMHSVRSVELIGAGILITNLNPVALRWHLEMTSDSLHATAVLVVLASLIAYTSSRHRGWILAAAIAAGLAALTRFIGVAVVMTGALYLFFLIEKMGWKRRFADTFMFGFIASAPISSFVFYNLAVNGTAGGQRGIHLSPVTEQLHEFFAEISRWGVNLMGAFARDAISEEVRVTVFGLMLLAGAGAAVYITIRASSSQEAKAIWLPFIFSVLYFVLMAVISSLLPLDGFSGRYTLPVLATVPLWGLAIVDRLYRLAGERRRWLRGGFAVLLIVVLIVPVRAAYALVSGTKSFGYHQVAAPAVRNSALVRDIRQAARESSVFAADKSAVQFMVIHLDRCFPVATPTDRGAVVEIDDSGIETGTRILGAPRLVFSTRTPDAGQQPSKPGPLGTIRIQP